MYNYEIDFEPFVFFLLFIFCKQSKKGNVFKITICIVVLALIITVIIQNRQINTLEKNNQSFVDTMEQIQDVDLVICLQIVVNCAGNFEKNNGPG